MMIQRAVEGELPACGYELVGVFDVVSASAKFGTDVIVDFCKNGHPRNYWLNKAGGSSVFVPRIPGRDEKHGPFAIFVATREANPGTKLPLSAEVDVYRAAYPCLEFNADWQNWNDVVAAFGGQVLLTTSTRTNSGDANEPAASF